MNRAFDISIRCCNKAFESTIHKAPRLTLKGVNTSGEFMRCCAQHDHSFGREGHLTSVDARAGSPSEVSQKTPAAEI